MPDLTFKLILVTDDANVKLAEVKQEAVSAQSVVEKPVSVKITAEQALATIRDVKIAVDGVVSVIGGMVRSMNTLLDASLGQRQSFKLASIAFGEAAGEMSKFASSMQEVTNFEDDQLLALMSKLSQTFKLNKDEIQQLVPMLLDFTEANKATGMTVESAFDLMGRALNGHTEMLGRYGIELDATRLKTEGVTYLVEKLGEDYGGTATALADLRLQNANAWGDIQENVGDMLTVLINPLLSGLRWLVDAYQSLSPVMQGFVAGIVVAIPLIGVITTAITALTAAYHALRVAMNPVAGIIGIVVGVLSALGLGLAAASVKTEAVTAAQKSMNDEIKDCGKQVSVEAEKFSLLSSRLLELRSQTSLTNADKTEMKNIIRSLNENYSEYLGNINLETSSYNNLATALRNASDALVQKKIAEVYGEKYNAQIRKVAELQIEIDSQQAEVDRVRARKQQLMNSVDWDFLTSDRNAMGFNPALYFGNDGEWLKLERRLNQFSALHGELRAAKYDLQQIGSAYRQAMLDAPDMSFTPNSNAGGTGDTGQSDYDERQRQLEQLAQLQQKYDVLAIDDLVARKQKELEIARDAELAKAQSLGASETLIQSIRDHYADESVRVETEAADARTKALEAQAAEELRIAEATAREQQRIAEEDKRNRQELEDTRFEFMQRGLELSDKTWDAELRAIDQYYARRKEKLLAAGLSEQQITTQSEAAKARIRNDYEMRNLQGAQQIMRDLAKTSEIFGKKGFALWKTLAIGQAMIDTYASATAAYKSMVGIPVVGPGLAVTAAAAAIGAGLANIAVIQSTEPPKAQTGGLLVGRSHVQGGILIEAEGDEYVTAKDRVKALGRGLFDFLNFAPIESVKLAFAGMPVPSVPIPANIGSYYASGGSIMNGGSINTIMDTIVSVVREEFSNLRQSISDNKPQFEINVDPLSNDPVKVSQIADKGKLIRSEV
jgi:predicted transposase YbfD/YdcC